MFKVGDNVVHLSHGVGTVVGYEEREFSPGKKQRFYILEIQDNGAPKKVFVPLESTNVRLRPIIKKEQVDKVFDILRTKQSYSVDHQSWNRRYREYMELIHGGKTEDVATVLRDLMKLKQEKDLSFGERKLLDQTLTLLTKELSIAMNESETYVQKRIEECFA